MKVLLAATSSESRSGASKCLLDLAQGLQKNGIAVCVLLPQKGNLGQELALKKIPYKMIHEYQCWYQDQNPQSPLKITLKSLLNIITSIQITCFIRKEKIDIVHINASTSYTAAYAARWSHKKLVWHIREFFEEDLKITFANPKKSYQLIAKADEIIAISESVKRKWEPLLGRSVQVIYDGVKLSDYKVEKKQYDSKAVHVLIYGRIVPGKGQLFFFEAMKEALKHSKANIQIEWAGMIEDASYYKEIDTVIQNSDLKEKTSYLGEIRDIKKVLQHTDIVCVCSKQEGFGRTTVEAMLAKCLVIGADTGATKELIRDGENGYLYREGSKESFVDVMCQAVCNIEASRKIAWEASKEAEQKYDAKRNLQEIIALYKRL